MARHKKKRKSVQTDLNALKHSIFTLVKEHRYLKRQLQQLDILGKNYFKRQIELRYFVLRAIVQEIRRVRGIVPYEV